MECGTGGCGYRRLIPLTRGKVAVIDAEDYERVSQHRWYAKVTPRKGREVFYAARRLWGDVDRTAITMHRFILDAPLNVDVDHKDGDGLNNTRENLRPATATQNARNAKKCPGATSVYKGVVWHRRDRVWEASIRVDKKLRYLGRFRTEIEAAVAYDNAARAVDPEFCLFNFPDGVTPTVGVGI